jgi:hypothetical protein
LVNIKRETRTRRIDGEGYTTCGANNSGGGLEVVVLVDADDDVPGAAEALGEGDEVAGAELDDALPGSVSLDDGPHPALKEVARQRRVELERVLPRRAAPSSSVIHARKQHTQGRVQLIALVCMLLLYSTVCHNINLWKREREIGILD